MGPLKPRSGRLERKGETKTGTKKVLGRHIGRCSTVAFSSPRGLYYKWWWLQLTVPHSKIGTLSVPYGQDDTRALVAVGKMPSTCRNRLIVRICVLVPCCLSPQTPLECSLPPRPPQPSCGDQVWFAFCMPTESHLGDHEK